MLVCFGDDMVSTWVTKLEGHVEEQITSLIHLQTNVTANDENFALAA